MAVSQLGVLRVCAIRGLVSLGPKKAPSQSNPTQLSTVRQPAAKCMRLTHSQASWQMTMRAEILLDNSHKENRHLEVMS